MLYSLQLYEIFYLITVIGSITVFLFLLYKGLSDRFQLIYALTNAALVVWGIGRYALLVAPSAEQAFLWVHILYIGSILVHIFFLHSVLIFLGIEKRRLWLLIPLYLNAAVLSFINLYDLFAGTSYFIASVGPKLFFPFYESPGPWYSLHLVQYLLIPQYVLVEMLLALRRDWSDYTKRWQHYLVIVSSIFGFLGGNTVVFLIYDIPLLPVGIIFVPINSIAMTYAILRFHLINFKTIATEIFSFAILTALLIEAVFSRTFLEALFRFGLFGIVAGFSFLLIRSVNREIEQRERIEKQERELEIANQQQESLLHFISHEVKGYMTKSEAAFASIVEGDMGEVNPQVKDMSHNAMLDVRKGVSMVMDILSAANLKRGTVTFKKAPLDFKAAVVAVVERVRPIIEKKGLTLKVDITPVNFKLDGDEEKLREHVIRNLIDNAIKYTPRGEVRIDLHRTDHTLQFSVTDSGVGISPDDMARLFTEGGRGKDSLKVNVDSTGYGLYIAKQVVDAHGGTIRAQSRGTGTGSTFIVELPTA